jgi:hypothetical protein
MHTSTLEKILNELDPTELAILVDQDTDINLLLKIIRKKKNLKHNNTRESSYILYLIFAAYHKKLGDLQSIINSISYSELKEIKRRDDFCNSYARKEIEGLIDKRCQALEQKVKTIDTQGEAIILFDDSPLFREIAVDNIWLNIKIFSTLMEAKNLLLLSTEPLESPSNWRFSNQKGVLPLRDERLELPFLRKYIDMKKYPRIVNNRGISISYSLKVVNKDNKFYWNLEIDRKSTGNDDVDLMQIKLNLIRELRSKFKFQGKEVECMVGTEEELLAKLKQKFPKEVK